MTSVHSDSAFNSTNSTAVPKVQRFEDLVHGTWYSLQSPRGGPAPCMEYVGPFTEGSVSEYLFKTPNGHFVRFPPTYLVTGPMPPYEFTPIELEIQRYRERGYPKDEDSAPGYLRPKDLVVGEWYQLENYGGHHSLKGKYTGATDNTTGLGSCYFECKYGSINPIGTDRIKPVDRISDWYVSGPIPADVITPADIQARKDEDAKYAAYVAALPWWKR